jgi:hypothetical protein
LRKSYEILKWAYIPENEELRNIEMDGLSHEFLMNRSTNAYHLLNSWKKIPGIDSEGNIDEYFLNDWIDKVRKCSSEIYRIKFADLTIGHILAEYPERDEIWPPKEICSVIERINTQSIKNGFGCATLNKRSLTLRGVFDGGDIERGNVAYFNKLSSNLRMSFPVVATILDDIARKYEEDAKRQDDEAIKKILEY